MSTTTQILTLTESAVSEVKKFIEAENAGPEAGLRIRVVPGGCSGFSYSMQIEDGPRQGDEILEQGGLKVFVDMFSRQYLEGVQVDYVNSVMGSGFTFSNPNSTGSCGCGSSFSV
ncbi:MAG TPA: iron-sulfur cluster assembly accessory protein [Blastocatellia bacterium]|nr:iron-sulfur cluster assembly accessory protein [Blastocatellia bacterium]